MFPRFDSKLKTTFGTLAGIYLCYYLGVFTHLLERDFYEEFDYPLAGDIFEQVQQLRRGEKPQLPPINEYNYSFISAATNKCHDKDGNLIKPRLVILVKSAMKNEERRNAIRSTWGYEQRFSDVIIRTVFILGVAPDIELQEKINAEQVKNLDIVQANFVDTYFNNTIKTMMGIKWVVSQCPKANFYLLADDDYYISVKNILKFIRNPANYPEYIEEAEEMMRQIARKLTSTRKYSPKFHHMLDENGQIVSVNQTRQRRQILEINLAEDARLFSGFVFKSAPHRHQTSKWYISLEEYPWHMWPTYVTAGAFVLSHEALFDIYYTSLYTKHFRFDDIYLGIVAMKAHIEPLHSEEFYFQRANVPEHKYLLASHGYGDPDELIRLWTMMRSRGYA